MMGVSGRRDCHLSRCRRRGLGSGPLQNGPPGALVLVMKPSRTSGKSELPRGATHRSVSKRPLVALVGIWSLTVTDAAESSGASPLGKSGYPAVNDRCQAKHRAMVTNLYRCTKDLLRRHGDEMKASSSHMPPATTGSFHRNAVICRPQRRLSAFQHQGKGEVPWMPPSPQAASRRSRWRPRANPGDQRDPTAEPP